MSETREPGSEVRMPIENGDPQAALEKCAELARADLVILGDDYIATFRDNPEECTISVWCEKRWWLR